MGDHIEWAKKDGREIPEWADHYDTGKPDSITIGKIPVWGIILVSLIITTILCGVMHNDDGMNVSAVCALIVGTAYAAKSMIVYFDNH